MTNGNTRQEENVQAENLLKWGVEVVNGKAILTNVALRVVPVGYAPMASSDRIKAKFNNTDVGDLLYLEREENGEIMRFRFITMRTLDRMKDCGYDENNRGITITDHELTLAGLLLLPNKEQRFLPTEVMVGIAEALLAGNSQDLSNIRSDLSRIGYEPEQALNQIRFSFAFLLEGFANAYEELIEKENILSTGYTQEVKQLANTTGEISYQRDERPPQPLFNERSEAYFACILSIHANAKEFNSENYDEAVKKRLQAFYAHVGALFESGAQRLFLNQIFGKESISNYHDYLPKIIRKAFYLTIKAAKSSSPIKSYLYGTLMEYNGMSLIRESYRLLMEGPTRRFMVMERYVPEIKTFLNWYDRNKMDDNFRYYWYSDPSKLDEVAQAKCVNLYSIVLRALKARGQMTKYKSSIISSESVEPDDLIVIPNIVSDVNNAHLVTPEYLALLRRRVQNPGMSIGGRTDMGVQIQQSLSNMGIGQYLDPIPRM